jgi:putative Mg2+ transporter-C (MgtC) family protein
MNIEDILIRLFLSCILGGIIGYERESLNRPAGFRTHILVCIGATVVMILNIYLVRTYSEYVNLDPGRFGAAVISGIGFLGAGTIIRQGANVTGLTTAASLWACACIGLAIGAGVFELGIIAAILVIVILAAFARFEGKFTPKKFKGDLILEINSRPGQIGLIGNILGKHNVKIMNIEIQNIDDYRAEINLQLFYPKKVDFSKLIEDFYSLEGINKVSSNSNGGGK